MGAFVTGLRNTVAKLKSLIKSGASHLHIQAGMSVVDEITALAASGKTAIEDITPVVDFLPVNATVKAEIVKVIAEVAPVLKSISTPDIVNAIKKSLAAEIVKIVTMAVSGQSIDPKAIEVDIQAIFDAEGITIS